MALSFVLLAMCSSRPASWFRHPLFSPRLRDCVHLILMCSAPYIVPLSLMSLLVRVSSLCVRELIVSQLVVLVLFFTLLVSLALHLVLLTFLYFFAFVILP